MKKSFVFFLTIFLCFACVSCRETETGKNNLTVNCIIQETETSVFSSYDLFRGTRVYSVTVGETPIRLFVEILTKDGDLGVSVMRNDTSEYSGNALPTSAFSVLLTESGSYTITVKANNHQGSYTFSRQEEKP